MSFDLLSDIKNGTSHSVDYLLDNSIEKTLSQYGIAIRKLLAPILRVAFSTQTEYKVIIDKREKLHRVSKGRIFAINHRQADDIVIGAKAVNQSGYIVFGNPYLAFETSNGFGLWAYGMILLRRDNAQSRKSAYEKMKYVIEHGENIIIYPEGYWNLDDNGEGDEYHYADDHKSDNWLVQDINIGILRLAQEVGCEIIPTVLHYDEVGKKRCYICRGGSFVVMHSDDIFMKKDELVTIMQTMYWNLCEKYSSYNRAELESQGKTIYEQWIELKETLRSACDIERIGYKLDLADEKRIGKAKVVRSVITSQDAFAYLHNLQSPKRSILVFNKRKKG